MKKAFIVSVCLLASACGQQSATTGPDAPSLAAAPMAHCAKDTDCKGDRICEEGKCVAPPAPTMPGTTPVSPATASDRNGIPALEDYPAPPRYEGPPAKLSLDSDVAKEYRSRLTEAMSGAPVFAGEYVSAGWGCGSGGCYVQALVNKRTGKAIETTFSAYNVIVDFEKMREERVGEEIETMKVDSALLITREVTLDSDGNPDAYFTKFYTLENGRLTLIKTIPAPGPTPEESSPAG